MAKRPLGLRLFRLCAVVAVVAGVLAAAGGEEKGKPADKGPKIYTVGQLKDKVGEGVSVSISIMLIGAISFMMGLFYLVNSEDDDIKRYAWKVVSATISIFCAVLLFQACNGLVEEYLIDGGLKFFNLGEKSPIGRAWDCLVDLFQLVFWLTMMQIVLAITSGAISEMSPNYLWQPENEEEIEIATKSWAVLFAHISGFAAINAWGSIQQNLLSSSPYTAILVVPIGLVGLLGLYKVFNSIREYISESDDGEVDEKEETWDNEAEESENDVAGLSLSFLTAQVVRFSIGGDLPNEEGKEPHAKAYNHTAHETRLLLLWGFIFSLGLVIVIRKRGQLPEHPEEIKSEREVTEDDKTAYEENEHIIRPLTIMNVYFTCGMAWCWFYGTYWAVACTGWTSQDAMLQVIIAIAISGVSFSIIWCFDKVEDSQIFGDEVDKMIDSAIDSLGILIGFSWEQSFDVAVDVISESIDAYIPKTVGRLLMSVALCAIVFPAWKSYILPTELELRTEATGLGQKKKKYRDTLDRHQMHFWGEDAALTEGEMDHAHLVLKLHRRKRQGVAIKPVADGEKPLKHMIMTVKGLMPVPDKGDGDSQDELLEELLPAHLREPEEEEAESRWSGALQKVKNIMSWRTPDADAADANGETKDAAGDEAKA